MSISAIGLRNFRGFRDAAIELKPLTVLLGPNSAGKSSFGHALASMAHAHKSYRGTPQASLTPPPDYIRDWPVDLGTSQDLRSHGTKGPIRIALQTSVGWIELGFGFDAVGSNLDLSYILHPYGDDTAAGSTLTETPASTVREARSGVVPLDSKVKMTPVADALEVHRVNREQWQERTEPVSVLLDGLLVKSIQHGARTARALSAVAREELSGFFETLTYLRATRKRPYRVYDKQVGKYQLN